MTSPTADTDRLRSGSLQLSSTAADGSEPTRETWGHRIEFLLATIGYAVGVGNVWRFPYLTYKYGGGTFLIPYCFALLLLGVPLFLLELALGLKFRQGTYHSLKAIDKRLRGVGVAACVTSCIVAVYYNIVITWSLYYLLHSFSKTLPYSDDAQSYWDDDVLNMSSGIGDISEMQWGLVGCLTLSWLFIYFVLKNGVKSTGKVVYITATVPYVLLVILFFRGVTLEGAGDGIEFYLKPDPSELLNPKVWSVAASQIFYSLGVAFGTLIAYSSYNDPKEDIVQDATLVPLLNCGTSVFAGFAIFSLLGYKANKEDVSVADVATGGTGLAFVVYPEGLAELPAPQLFAVMFFLMLFFLGVDSEFATVEVMTTLIKDLQLPISEERAAALVCGFGYILGLIFVTDGGIYWFELMDSYVALFGLFIIAFAECYAVAWIYGCDRLVNDIYEMTGRRIPAYFPFVWKYVCPVLLLMLALLSIVNECVEPVEIVDEDYDVPGWARAIGWLVAFAAPLSLLPHMFFPNGFDKNFEVPPTLHTMYASVMKVFGKEVPSRTQAANRWGGDDGLMMTTL